jgi:hypothetical protein
MSKVTKYYNNALTIYVASLYNIPRCMTYYNVVACYKTIQPPSKFYPINMKKTVFFTTILFLGAIGAVSAQGLFKVIASSGTNSKGGATVKIGTQVASTDQVVVGAKSYLGLSYAKGGTVQISKAGTYSAKDLETKLLASAKSSAQKYADFIIGEVVKSGDGSIHKNPYAYQNVTGSVERTLGSGLDVDVLLPKTNKCLGNTYTFSWLPKKNATAYIIQIKDNFSEMLKNVTVNTTSFTFDLNAPEFKSADFITVTVATKETASKSGLVEYAFEKPEDFFLQKLTAFQRGLGEGFAEIAQKQLELAVFLEENGYLLDAQQAYKKATEIEPNNEIFMVAHNQFLIRHKTGLVDEKFLNANSKE